MPPSYSEMIRVFGRIGLLSFGGPAAQISLMHRELVDERPWLDDQSFLRALSLCMMLPGPEAMQLATYCGWRLRGVPGGLIAGGLFVLPGAVVIAALVWLYAAFGTLPLVEAAFLGIKAAVIAIVIGALWRLAPKAFTRVDGPWLAVLAFFALYALQLPFPLIVLLAAGWGWLRADLKAAPAPVATPPTTGLWRTGAVWTALWLLPLIGLSVTGQTLLADLGWFFARLAVVTFGGAYAVLAYMTQTVVTDHGWLSTQQMIDALGLAETTPGPLILVTQFVAMLTGQIQGGPALALAAGAVALWATFVPCFLWIFLAGPYVEWIAARPRLTAALQAVTAAVVGVIANLSLWFALHVLFGQVGSWNLGPAQLPWPGWSSLDPVALGLTGLAAALLLGLKRGPDETLAVMALAALAVRAIFG